MISGGTKPPRPPAAPTSPVTPPTRAGSVTLAISAKVAPLPEPSAAAIARNATVPTCSSRGVVAATAAPTTTTAYPPANTGIAPNRSDRQPPTGRVTTATTTKPAIRVAAPAASSGEAVLRYDGR